MQRIVGLRTSKPHGFSCSAPPEHRILHLLCSNSIPETLLVSPAPILTNRRILKERRSSVLDLLPPHLGAEEEREARVGWGLHELINKRRQGRGASPPPRQPLPLGAISSGNPCMVSPTHCSSGHPRLGSCWPPLTTRMQRSKPPGRPAKPGPPSISRGAFQKNVFQEPIYSSVRASAAVSSSSISAYS